LKNPARLPDSGPARQILRDSMSLRRQEMAPFLRDKKLDSTG